MSHRPFGDLAERLYGIDPRAVEDAWVEQYIRTAGVVDLQQIKIEADAATAQSSIAGRHGSFMCCRSPAKKIIWKMATSRVMLSCARSIFCGAED